jgi:aminoglycoside phosphotransferase (APT) family kinase protein
MHVWAAEQHVDEGRARRLIRSQFPDLPAESVERVSEGWDYVVHRVDSKWAFRFPRRAAVVPGTDREIRVLPAIAARLPVSVPAPEFVGVPDDEFPWPFYGARYLPGVEATGATFDATGLALALKALHAPERLAAVGELPADPMGRVDMTIRAERTRVLLGELGAEADELLAAAASLPPTRHSALCHGDLHMRQVLVECGVLTGIVDWVDVCRSDPAVDLSIAWSLLDAERREVFFDAYGAVEDETRLRARVVAAFLSGSLAKWARAEDVPSVETAALAGLARAASGN